MIEISIDLNRFARGGPQRAPIDFFEGQAVLRAANAIGHRWRGCRVPIYIDNSAFQLSFAKGRSKAPRLNQLLRELFFLSVRLDCVFYPIWISTHDNVAADALSRGDFARFFEFVECNFQLSTGQCIRWSAI